MSNIDIWFKSVEKIKNANKIIVVGYSFNYADEHFNDLIRKNKDKDIIIIDPFPKNIINNLQRIFNYRQDDYTHNTVQGKEAFESERLTIIGAYASDIDFDIL